MTLTTEDHLLSAIGVKHLKHSMYYINYINILILMCHDSAEVLLSFNRQGNLDFPE